MLRALKKRIWKILNTLRLGAVTQLVLESALKDYGWFRSYHSKQSVDANGNPIPWYTYTFIFFLKPRLRPHFDVFEYGSGNSTRWYAPQVSGITAVEHDTGWAEATRQKVPGNASVLSRPLGEEYVQAISEGGRKYHLIIVDGRKRVKCVKFAIDYLTPDGVLILDNSEREWYQPAKDALLEKGFRQIDFRGILPIISQESCTTVFYRPGNCLGI